MSKKPEITPVPKTAAEIKQEKKENFVRVCEPRAGKAIKAIGLVGLCSSDNYIYSKEQASAVVLALETAVKDVKAKFAGEATKAGGFKLPTA